MNPAIQSMLKKFNPKTGDEFSRALREILQSITLLGLWRGKFFERAAFYGGTALRILFNLDRFSEDIDFSLMETNSGFSLTKYEVAIRNELTAFGFEVEFGHHPKVNSSAIDTIILKFNTIDSLKEIGADNLVFTEFHRLQKIKVKIEVDTNPPPGFATEMNPILLPIPFQARTYSLPDMFAGKMHAALFRNWKKRVKGRDWYDIVWYIGHYPKLNLFHLEQRMRASGDWTSQEKLDQKTFIEFYDVKIDNLNMKMAIRDVEPFLTDPRVTEVWSKDFFRRIGDEIVFISQDQG